MQRLLELLCGLNAEVRRGRDLAGSAIVITAFVQLNINWYQYTVDVFREGKDVVSITIRESTGQRIFKANDARQGRAAAEDDVADREAVGVRTGGNCKSAS